MRKDANARLAGGVFVALEQLRACAVTFREYEALHRAKGTPDGDAKAKANAEQAERCEAAIEHVELIEGEYVPRAIYNRQADLLEAVAEDVPYVVEQLPGGGLVYRSMRDRCKIVGVGVTGVLRAVNGEECDL